MTSLPELTSQGDVRGSTDEELDAAEEPLGLRLPESYRTFAKRHGFGLSLGFIMIYVPRSSVASPVEDLVEMSRVLGREAKQHAAYRASRPPSRFVTRPPFGPDGSAERLSRLVHFAMDENGNRYGWDPAEPQPAGEMWIYEVDSNSFFMHRAAPDLGAFLRRALEPNLGGILGNASFTLEPTFRPWHVPPAPAP